jgi:hypothetical protein
VVLEAKPSALVGRAPRAEGRRAATAKRVLKREGILKVI